MRRNLFITLIKKISMHLLRSTYRITNQLRKFTHGLIWWKTPSAVANSEFKRKCKGKLTHYFNTLLSTVHPDWSQKESVREPVHRGNRKSEDNIKHIYQVITIIRHWNIREQFHYRIQQCLPNYYNLRFLGHDNLDSSLHSIIYQYIIHQIQLYLTPA